MAKISSSKPPPQKPQRTRSSSQLRAADSGARASEAAEGSLLGNGDGPTTLAEALGRERELREDRLGFNPEKPWEDPQSEREDKQRADEHRARKQRVQAKADGQRPGARTPGQRVAQQPGQGAERSGRLGGQAFARSRTGESGFDGFEGPRTGVKAQGTKPVMTAPPLGGMPIAPTPPPRLGGGAIHILNSAKEPGVYFREEGREDGRTEEDEDPELAEAVEEAIRLLFGVRGIHRIGPGVDDGGQPVIVITTSRGFSHASMRAVPERVHRFKTLVALPYELLPLRRDIS